MEKILFLIISMITFATAFGISVKMFGNVIFAIFGGAIYSLAPYRFYVMYIGKDIGELISWAIFPIIVYIMWHMCCNTDKFYKRIAIVIVGFFGCMFFMNLSWWITCIKQIADGNLHMEDNYSLQSHGVYFIHYLMSYFKMGNSTDFNENGLIDSAPLGMGFIITVGVLAIIWLILIKKIDSNADVCGLFLLLGCVVVLLSSNSFPWDDIKYNYGLYKMVWVIIKEPFRFMGIATVLFWILGLKAYWILYGIIKKWFLSDLEDWNEKK